MTDKTIESPTRYDNFWLIAAVLAVLLGVILARDITRPFTGLHSWAQASGAWAGRSHAKYGLGFTKGVSTFAVGSEPSEPVKRYWDHPQLSGLMSGVAMILFGINEYSTRIMGLAVGIIAFLFFLRILRGICFDDNEALLAGLLFIVLPLTGYFGVGGWIILCIMASLWSYLVIIGAFYDKPQPRLYHKIVLAVSLFLGLQFSWLGFFYAFAIGSHYVIFECLFKKRRPQWGLLSILFFAPVLSMLLTFIIMAAGYGWDVQKIIDLYIWRSAKGEMQNMEVFDWNVWFAKLWEFSVEDFTKPLLFISLAYITIGQLFVFMENKKDETAGRRKRQFPFMWLFIFPMILFLLVFKGLVWRHQYWLRPIGFPVAIAGAMAILMIGDFIKRMNKKAALAVMAGLIALISGYGVMGTNYFHDIRWQPLAKIDMFKGLNEAIPPEKRLLSFEDFIVNQHKSKGGFIRPEIAWYLDREIDTARTLEEIQQKAASGEYPYYLMPLAYYDQQTTQYLNQLAAQLRQTYKSEYVPGVPGKRTDEGEFLRAGMNPYMIFDLNSKIRQ